MGPGYLVAVGYMDPGNWATDLAGGSQFGYTLLTVILISNLMAILLQGLASKLGIVTGRDLAQACRDHYSKPVVWFLWIICELAIAACDLAEVIGSAIALNLLFGIQLPVGIAITALDVLIVLYLQNKGFRLLEALVITLVATVGIFLPAFLYVMVSGPLVPRIRRSPVAGAALDGVNAASLALMAVVSWQLGRAALVDPLTIALAAASLLLLLRWKVNSAWLVAGGAAIGALARAAGHLA